VIKPTLAKLEENCASEYKSTEWKWILRLNELLPEVSAQPTFQNTTGRSAVTDHAIQENNVK